MARFTVTHVRHHEHESHAIIRIRNVQYPCVATRRIIDGERPLYVVQHTFGNGSILEVSNSRLNTAWDYMGEALVEWLDAEDRASKGIVRGRGIKKRSTVTGDDAAYLSRLSKAALVDLLTEALRVNAGACDTPLTVEQVRERILDTMLVRGDRLPR